MVYNEYNDMKINDENLEYKNESDLKSFMNPDLKDYIPWEEVDWSKVKEEYAFMVERVSTVLDNNLNSNIIGEEKEDILKSIYSLGKSLHMDVSELEMMMEDIEIGEYF